MRTKAQSMDTERTTNNLAWAGVRCEVEMPKDKSL